MDESPEVSQARSTDSGREGAAASSLPGLLEAAAENHRAGRRGAANRLYRAALEASPGHPDALHLLGLLALEEEEPRRAADLVRRAVEARPEIGAYRLTLGAALDAAGELEAAAEAYREAIERRSGSAEAAVGLATVLARLGPPQEAAAAWERVLEAVPDSLDALIGLGDARRRLDALEGAEAAYRRACETAPDAARAHDRLGRILRARGRLGEAVAAHRHALALAPEAPDAWLGLGRAQIDAGEHDGAIESLRTAVRLRPDDGAARRALASVLAVSTPREVRPGLEEDLVTLLEAPGIDHADIATFATALAARKHGLGDGAACDQRTRDALLADPLLTRALALCVNTDPAIERALCASRRELLGAAAAGVFDDAPAPGESARRAMSVLALQGACNEHVLPLGEDERDTLHRLRAWIEAEPGALPEAEGAAARLSPTRATALLAFAMYAPLEALACASRLAAFPDAAWDDALLPVVRRTLREPREERALRAEIPTLGEMADEVSRAVAAQYERHPYPRWLEPLHRGADDLASILRGMFPGFVPDEGLRGPLRVLVPGCGTGQHAISIALRYRDCEVLATDLSARSLAYGLRMARAFGVDNVTFVRNDILDIDAIDDRFHAIECVGVLHHLRSPDTALRALVERLLPGAVIKLGLYSERARAPLARAGERIRALGIEPSDDGIRALHAHALAAGPRDPLRDLLAFRDFYTLSNCRDLLFHAYERRFTLPGVRRLLDDAGLALIGFESADLRLRRAYTARHPDDPAMSDLDRVECFEAENPGAFAGMYQFWCRPSEC